MTAVPWRCTILLHAPMSNSPQLLSLTKGSRQHRSGLASTISLAWPAIAAKNFRLPRHFAACEENPRDIIDQIKYFSRKKASHQIMDHAVLTFNQ